MAPDGMGLGRGAAGVDLRGSGAVWGLDTRAAAGATSRSAGGCSLLPLAAGPEAPFPGSSRAETSARAPGVDTGAPRALTCLPLRATMNGSVVPGLGGSGYLRPDRASALAPGLAPVPACRLPFKLPGAGEDRLGSALPVGRPGSFGNPSSNYRS